MADLSADEVRRRSQDLVNKVAYSMYDSPYILLLRVFIDQDNQTNSPVISEKRLAEILDLAPNDVRKYLGMLHVHHLIKRHVNKERQPLTGYQQRVMANGGQVHGVAPGQMSKSRDVIYWYLDYREFADVVKYRIAMMRKAIDEKIKNEVGKRGYICPNCAKVYDPLEVARLMDPSGSAFLCDLCGTELVEDDPSLHGDEGQGQDRMQRFNTATAPIRDALKSIEGAKLPSVNIASWIAHNVKVAMAPADGVEAGPKSHFEVRMGNEDDGDARKKEAEAQREKNALPVWHLESTVTGDATALGHDKKATEAKAAAERAAADSAQKQTLEEDAALAAYYDNMEGAGEDAGEDENDMEEAELGVPEPAGDTPATSTPAPDTSAVATPANADVTVMVGGKPMRLADIGDAEEQMMTPDEYEAYYAAADAAEGA